MANNLKHRFLRGANGEDGCVAFDEKGYIIEAKGFGSLIWWPNTNIDKDLIGKHVDELAEMLKEYGANREVYSDFEIQVHIELLKKMLKNQTIR